MGTSLIVTLIATGASLLLNFLPARRATTPAPATDPTPKPAPAPVVDPFSWLPIGAPGHPVLNGLFGNLVANSTPPVIATPAINEALNHAAAAGFAALIKGNPALAMFVQGLLTQPVPAAK